MTSEPSWDNGLEGVEKQLWRVCRKLKKREVTAKILGRMAKENVAKGDVRSFAVKQAMLKHANKQIHLPTVKHTMRNKFRDATSSIGELRRRKKELSDVLHNRFKYPRSKCRNLIKTYMEQAAYHKERHKDRLTKKFKHCRKRMKVVTNDLLDKKTVLPQDVQDLIGGVNIFTTTIEPERSADPMVCDKTIKLSKSELACLPAQRTKIYDEADSK